MNKPRIFFTAFKKPKQIILKPLRNFHLAQELSQRSQTSRYAAYNNADRSLFFTNLPHEKRPKKVKPVKKLEHYGNIIIECKNRHLNHYSGMQYGKFDVIPLASKGWHHTKSKGDYFTILPSEMHPAFLAKEVLPDTFEENGVSAKLIEQLKKINVTHPTIIQAKAISRLMRGENVFMTGECGSGKTLAYVISLIENILKWKDNILQTYNAPIGIILLPTRELAIQVGLLADALGSDLGVNCKTLIGGDIKDLLLNPETHSVDLLTCTLLVLQKHLNAGLYTTKRCKQLVIDECDTLTDDSFIGPIKYFIKTSELNFTGFASPNITPNSAQICFVSAAVPSTLEETLFEIIRGNNMEQVSTFFLHKPYSYARQIFKRVSKIQKPQELLQIAQRNVKAKIPTMIFCNKTATSYWLNSFLSENKVECGLISKTQFATDRLRHYRDFEAGITNIIVCTDLASRGLDFRTVKQVINYEFPSFMIDYIHRCGRTGRIGQGDDCIVTNFISGRHELPLLHKIEIAVRTNSQLPNIYQNRRLRYNAIKK